MTIFKSSLEYLKVSIGFKLRTILVMIFSMVVYCSITSQKHFLNVKVKNKDIIIKYKKKIDVC